MTLSAEQLEVRRWRVGSSEIGVLLGVDVHRTALDLFKSKVYGIRDPSNDAMEWGHEVEVAALKFLERVKGIKTMSPGTLTHPKYDHVCATPDAIEIGGERRVYEVKNISRWMLDSWGYSDDVELPMRHRAQIQFELGCAMARGLSGPVAQCVPIFAGDAPNDYQYRVEFSESTFGVLVEVAAKFVRDCLIPKREPVGWEQDRGALDYVKARFKDHDSRLKPATDEARTAARQLAHAKKRLAKWERAVAVTQARLCNEIADAEGIKGVATWRASKKGIRTLRLLGEE